METPLIRRSFLKKISLGGLSFTLPLTHLKFKLDFGTTIRLGLIADLHQDIMHDGKDRMEAFVSDMLDFQPHAVVQLGDFAIPKTANKTIVDLYHSSPGKHLHVIGNHDTDGGYTIAQCVKEWGMPDRYYISEINGLTLIVLDANESGSPSYKGGYASYIGKDQLNWLKFQLSEIKGNIIIFSHQPLAGTIAVDNSIEIQELISPFYNKIIACICGHSHTDQVFKKGGITYIHINSASYFWVGDQFQNQSYSNSIHLDFPWISRTCPYKDSIFARLIIDPIQGKLSIKGKSSYWVGKSPYELGSEPYSDLLMGEDISPGIRNRNLFFQKH